MGSREEAARSSKIFSVFLKTQKIQTFKCFVSIFEGQKKEAIQKYIERTEQTNQSWLFVFGNFGGQRAETYFENPEKAGYVSDMEFLIQSKSATNAAALWIYLGGSGIIAQDFSATRRPEEGEFVIFGQDMLLCEHIGCRTVDGIAGQASGADLVPDQGGHICCR